MQLDNTYQPLAVYECACCEQDICSGDIAYKLMGETFCADCVIDSVEVVD